MIRAVFIHDHNFVYSDQEDLYYDGSGGAFDKHLWNRYLSIFNHLTVVGRRVDKLPNNLVLSSCPNVDFHLIDNIGGLRNLKNRNKAYDSIFTVIDNVDFAIIRLPSNLGKIAVDICKKLDKKYVLEIVGDPFEAYWYHGNPLGKIIGPFEYFQLKNIVSAAQNVIYVTKSNLQKRYPPKYNTTEISNVRLLTINSKSSVNKFYERKFSDKFKIGLIGSFHVKYKGHIEAIKSLNKLVKDGVKDIELYLVGTGNFDWVKDFAIKMGVIDYVNFVGTLEAGESGVFSFLDTIDLYIHPSKTEGLPRVVLEAMSRGKICLASDVGGTNELISREFIHNPGDWKKLASQILDVYSKDVNSKITIALNNLIVAEEYLECNLNSKRVNFIKNILNEAN